MRKTKVVSKPPKKSPQQQGWVRQRVAVVWVSVLLMAVLCWVWVTASIPRNTPRLDVHVSTGQSAKSIAQELRAQGLMVNPFLFSVLARVQGLAGQLKAGRYQIPQGMNTLELTQLLSKGQGMLNSVSLVEGFTADALLEKLRKQADLVDDLRGLTGVQIARKFGLEGQTLEGWIYPDTYRYAPRSTLSEFLNRAIQLQKQALSEAWAQRDPRVPLKTPYEALILASIVEKETGRAQDRPKVASVFVNRLRTGMMLQTDPTVIYGLGAAFDGNLTKKHLQTDTIYNTYTRTGLPPTPISTPSKAALYAAVRPEETPYYYFVAQGDGSSYFSKSLTEHNNAVRKFQLGR